MAAINDVFISYRRLDKEFVRKLDAALRADNREVWVDYEDIAPGVLDFQETIKQGIDSARAVILVLTPSYLESEFTMMELDYAHSQNKRLVPIILEDIGSLQVPPSISHINWVYFNGVEGFDTAFQKLRVALDTDFEHVDTHTELLLRAVRWADRGHDPSLLLRGNALDYAETWLQKSPGKDPKPSELHLEYIQKSRLAAIRRRRINIAISIVVSLIIGLAIAAGVLAAIADSERGKAEIARADAEDARDRAIAERAEAQRQRELAEQGRERALRLQQEAEANESQAQSLALAGNSLVVMEDDNTDLAISLAMAAFEEDNTLLEVERALATAAYSPGTRLVMTGHNGWVRDVAFIPNTNQAVSASADGVLIIWDLESGAVIRRLRGHTSDVTSVEVTPDGKYAVSGSGDRTLRIWDLETGTVLHILSGHRARVRAVALSADGRWAVSGGEDGTIRYWNVETGELIQTFSPSGVSIVLDVAFSPTDNLVLASYDRGRIALWDLVSGEETRLIGHTGWVMGVAFAPDGQHFISGGEDETLCYWDIADTSTCKRFIGHADWVTDVQISPNGEYALSASSDTSIRLWRLSTGEQVQRLAGHEDLVWSAVFAPQTDPNSQPLSIISGSEDYSVRLWDLTTGVELATSNFGEVLTREASAIAINADKNMALIGTEGGELILWNIAANAVSYRLTGHQLEVNTVAISPDGLSALSASTDTGLVWWNLETGTAWRMEYDAIVTSVAYVPNRNLAVAAYDNNTIILWNLDTYEIERSQSTVGGHRSGSDVTIVAVSPDGSVIATGAEDEKVVLWDTQTGEILQVLTGHSDIVRGLAFKPDGTTLVSSADDNRIIEWDVATGEQLGIFEGHTGRIWDIAYTPDGTRIVSGSSDRTMRVWDSDNNLEIRRFVGHTAEIRTVIFDSTGTIALSGSLDGTIRTWRVDRLNELVEWVVNNRYVRLLTENECRVYRSDTFCEGDDFLAGIGAN